MFEVEVGGFYKNKIGGREMECIGVEGSKVILKDSYTDENRTFQRNQVLNMFNRVDID